MTSTPSKIILKENEKVYKVAMSDTYFSDDDYIYFKDNSLIAISSNTGKLSGSSKNTQTEIFENMCTGDYFYLSGKNTGVILLGRIIDEKPVKCSYKNYGNDGWIQRTFVLISDSIKTGKPNTNKRWAPSGYSTCVDIPEKEMVNANELLFIPFFNTSFEYKEGESTVDTKKAPSNSSATKHSLNQILFGPPGTGKTFNTINKALEIIGENINDLPREDIKKIFDQKMKDGQIVFTTFHQSMCYEDFIEGIKPIEPEKDGEPVIYKNLLGVFRTLCVEASFNVAELIKSKTTKDVLDFSMMYDNFVESCDEKILSGQTVELSIKSGEKVIIDNISKNRNFSIKHKNKTQTYIVSKDRLSKLHLAINNLDEVNNINDYFRKIIGGCNSSAYWSVLNAIRKQEPVNATSKTERTFSFEEKLEVVQNLNKSDYAKIVGKPYVIIIDEINRGNISQIFGELVTLIEEDKRLGNQEALEVTLPYSKEKFGVPNNLYIIGTMNTADRSVEALDAALRRRFSFIEMPPISQLIKDEGKLKETKGKLDEISLPEILDCINSRIEKLLDKDHLIGHSYFMTVSTLQDLKSAFQNKIVPLLQEYFFGDFGKIGLVLGNGFVEIINNNNGNVFANFSYEDASEFAERTIFKLKNIEDMNDDNFKTAINLLLNK